MISGTYFELEKWSAEYFYVWFARYRSRLQTYNLSLSTVSFVFRHTILFLYTLDSFEKTSMESLRSIFNPQRCVYVKVFSSFYCQKNGSSSNRKLNTHYCEANNHGDCIALFEICYTIDVCSCVWFWAKTSWNVWIQSLWSFIW